LSPSNAWLPSEKWPPKLPTRSENPLLSIGGFARRLERRLDTDLREHAKIIVDEVRRLEGILNNTLSFVKSTITERREVTAADLINDITTFLEPAVNERGNVLKKEVDIPFQLMINYDRVKEAILNLISNANHATENGTIFVRVYQESIFSVTRPPGASGRRKRGGYRDTGHRPRIKEEKPG